MAVNGYFQLEMRDGKFFFQAFAPEDGGKMFGTDEVLNYFDSISFDEFDTVQLDTYIQMKEFETPLFLGMGERLPESEKCVVNITDKADRALVRFYPPTTGGALLEESDIISSLQSAGIKHGIRKKAIQHFLGKRSYCRDYIMAEATYPVEGHDASIEYFFDVNATAKPKLNEDGSVDFHHLGNIIVVEKGTKLATLTPADRGKAGVSVLGNPLMPTKVKARRLRFGRNIRLSENKCHIYADTDGYVTLVDDMVMLSDIYRVPANVDVSTGDIDFNGTVEVTGNVNTGYIIEAAGDIIVNGVVEGATLKAGGNIVLKRGMQGMERGELEAGGNITAKFIENSKVRCGGGLKADAVLHSEIDCKDDVEVRGKKGLINGGYVRTYGSITATSLGSTMGTSTKLEVISDKDLQFRKNELEEKIAENEESLKKIDSIADAVKSQLVQKKEIPKEQIAYIKNATEKKPALKKEIQEMKYERETIKTLIQRNRTACIRVERDMYAGVVTIVRDAMKIQHEKQCHCRFVRDGADVKMEGL